MSSVNVRRGGKPEAAKPTTAHAPNTAAAGSAKPLSIEDLIMALPSSQAPEAVMTLSLVERSISAMPPQLAFLKNLRKLDLSQNSLTDVTPLAKLANLSQLKVAHNRISTLRPLKGLSKLAVLDVSHNELVSLEGVQGLPSLIALIAPSNRITDVTPLANCKLETVVLSRNPLRSETLVALNTMSATLRKVSMSQCELSEIPPLDLALVTELRLNGNSLSQFAEGTALRSLKILDVSNNKLETLFSMRPFSVFIQQLSIHGNPLAEDDNPAPDAAKGDISIPMKRIIGGMFKNIKLLDAKPFTAPTNQEMKQDRRRRADGETPAAAAASDVDKATPAEAKPAAAAKSRPLQPSAPEPVDAVYTGEVPELPPQKNYVRATKVHRSEAQQQLDADASPASRGGKDVVRSNAAQPAQRSNVPAAVAGGVVLKGAAALALLTADDDVATGW